jgi:uncharacterized membrane protein YfcA
VAANVTNTVALVFSSVGSVLGSRQELTGRWQRLQPLVISGVLGGAAGGALLLLTPADTFSRIVPVLIALASLAILLPRRPAGAEHRHEGAPLVTAVFLVGVYGGYFGAAAGVLVLALFLRWTSETLARSNAAKNLVLGAANLVAAVGFTVFGPVHWAQVVPLAIGCLIGGRTGPIIVRRSPPQALRLLIAAAGLALAAYLAVDAY